MQKEMPSLSELSRKLPNLKVYAINMEKPNIKKVQNFYNDLKINNIKIYFDPEFNLAKKLKNARSSNNYFYRQIWK